MKNITPVIYPDKSASHPGRDTYQNLRWDASVHVVFRKTEHVDTRDFQAFAAQWLAYALPYRRFTDILADASARLGANADMPLILR